MDVFQELIWRAVLEKIGIMDTEQVSEATYLLDLLEENFPKERLNAEVPKMSGILLEARRKWEKIREGLGI